MICWPHHLQSVNQSQLGDCVYLKVSALLVDGNDEPVDIGDELVTLRLPEAIGTLLQQLHQHLLNSHTDEHLHSTLLPAVSPHNIKLLQKGTLCLF